MSVRLCPRARASASLREGGGIREVGASLRSAGLAPPRYIDKGIKFTEIVPCHALLPTDDVAWLAANDADHRLSSMESQILTSMRHGQVWANSTVRDEFPSTDSREAGRALRHLVELGFAEALGERGGRQYRLDPRWKVGVLPDRPTVVVSAPTRPAAQDELPDLMTSDHADPTHDLVAPETRKHPAGRGAPSRRAVLLSLSEGPLTVRVIAETTGLSIDSVRNALRRLIDEGDVRVNGGWGVKGTTYEVTGAPPRS